MVYDVEDTKAGQAAMREVINTHWGEDSNPWCLLQGDGQTKHSVVYHPNGRKALERDDWMKWIQDGLSLYLNKQRIQTLIAQH